MVLSSTLTCALSAAHQGLAAADAALELRRVTDLVDYLMATAPMDASVTAGLAGDLDWRRTVSEPTSVSGTGAVCARAVEVRGLRSGRRYSAQGSMICPRDIKS